MTTRPVIRWTHVFVDRPTADLGSALGFWTAVTGTKVSEPRGVQGEFVTLLPGAGDPYVKAQGVGDGAGGAHLDLSVDDVPALVESALRLGAEVVSGHDGWAVLRSPGGQLFCAVPWNGESARPPVVEGPGGTTSRLRPGEHRPGTGRARRRDHLLERAHRVGVPPRRPPGVPPDQAARRAAAAHPAAAPRHRPPRLRPPGPRLLGRRGGPGGSRSPRSDNGRPGCALDSDAGPRSAAPTA